MAYLHEDTLRKKAEEFIKILAKWGIKSQVEMVRDYFIKLSVEKENRNYGNFVIDYKAKKNTFSIRTQELTDKSLEEDLHNLWEKGELPDDEVKAEPHAEHGKETGKNIYEIYVDGSFINGCVGYGVVILRNGRLFKELSGLVTDNLFTGSRQVGGEITGVIEALKWCKNQGISEISMYYDFENLKKWVTGEYLANTVMSATYRDFVRNCGVLVHWNKVLGHSGVRWNERADELAKSGAGLQTAGTQNQEEQTTGVQNTDLLTKKPGATGEQSTGTNTKTSEGLAIENKSEKLLEELEDIAEEFSFFLECNGYIAEYLRIDNSMAAKIRVEKDDRNLGYINIYNTSKLHLQPRYHEIRDSELRIELDKLWKSFIAEQDEDKANENKDIYMEKSTTSADFLSSVEFYYNIFKKYRDCDFNFQYLRDALKKAYEHAGMEFDNSENLYSDFNALEILYFRLKQKLSEK
jgi:ribonuclease HI